MRIALFVPCYVDAFEPQVGIATLELLKRFSLDVTYPFDQTCCGQPMANTGCHEEAAATEALFVRNFTGFDYIVAPSGSCVHQVREHLTAIPQTPDVAQVRAHTFELVEFLHDVLKVDAFPWATFPQGKLPQQLRRPGLAPQKWGVSDEARRSRWDSRSGSRRSSRTRRSGWH